VSGAPGRVLVVMGKDSPDKRHLIGVIQSRGLVMVVVACGSDALGLLTSGETPNAILLLDALHRRPDCFVECAHEERARLDCIIDCIRRYRGLEHVPVMHYTLDAKSDLPPEELAALISAVVTMSDNPPRRPF
jgi:hypothetical protein